jgi:hypothetical protein
MYVDKHSRHMKFVSRTNIVMLVVTSLSRSRRFTLLPPVDIPICESDEPKINSSDSGGFSRKEAAYFMDPWEYTTPKVYVEAFQPAVDFH